MVLVIAVGGRRWQRQRDNLREEPYFAI